MPDVLQSALPRYASPPVNEVACGCRIAPLGDLKLPQIGLLWLKFRAEFPLIEHAAPIVNDPAGFSILDQATGLPWPRVWFVDETQTRLIQFQPDRFYFNWRRQDAATVYPHFDVVFAEFQTRFALLEEFSAELRLGPILPQDCDLTYINHIPISENSQLTEHLRRIFLDFRWSETPQRFLPPPKTVAWQAVFPLPGNMGQLTAKLNEARKKDTGEHMLILELVARGIGPDKTMTGIASWFALAHEWIVRGFTDLTTPDIQTSAWGREDAATR